MRYDKLNGSWLAQVRDATGKRVSARFQNKVDAQKFEMKIVRERECVRRGIEAPMEKTLFLDFAQDWLVDRKVFRPQATWSGDESKLRLTWLPRFGGNLIESITTQEIQKELNKIITSGKAPATYNRHRALLHKFFKDAVKAKLLLINPVDGIEQLPEKRKKRINGHWESVDEATRYIEACFDIVAQSIEQPRLRDGTGGWFVKTNAPCETLLTNVWGTLATLLVWAGPRISEALALRWCDVDWDRARVVVKRTHERSSDSVQERTKGQREGGSYNLPLFPIVRAALILWRQLTPFNGATDFIFHDRSGKALRYNRVYRFHMRVIEFAKLPRITVHGIRHTCVTLLLKSGFTHSEVQILVGHATVTTTEGYGHIDLQHVLDKAEKCGFGTSKDVSVLPLRSHEHRH